MEPQPDILSFVKAMASADRLRIVGLLSQGPKRAAEIAWSPDNRQVSVTVTEITDHCQPPTSVADWELDVETGEFVEVSNKVFPTVTP